MRGLDRIAIRCGCLWFNPIRSRAYFCKLLTDKNNANMQKANHKSRSRRDSRFDSVIISKHKIRYRQALHTTHFIIGELYLFHQTKLHCPSRSSLWGIYDRAEDGILYLESSTLDLVHFKLWHCLPVGYRYFRRATRRELRDYMYNLGRNDSQMRHINTKRQLLKIRPQSPLVHLCPRHSCPLDVRNA